MNDDDRERFEDERAENREPRREPDESQWAFRARKDAWQRKHGGPEPEDFGT
jgi:hypothetical protein